MAENAIQEELALLLLLMRRRKRRRLHTQRWERSWVSRRQEFGVFHTLVTELATEDPKEFRRFHRMDRADFEKLLGIVGPAITKQETHLRQSIGPAERLSVTLRFLATGESFGSLSYSFRIGERTLSGIIEDVCCAIYEKLQPTQLKVPKDEHEWLNIAEDFKSKWNYPCCVGALDGKHVMIKKPHNSGSQFYNYKKFYSIVLMALVDANYKFICVDVGAPGRASDAGLFAKSSLKACLDFDKFSLPQPAVLEGTAQKCNFHIIGDDAFPLRVDLMKPYPFRNLDKTQRIFNYRLSRARRVVENSFGMLANRFRVLLTAINLQPEKVTTVVLATCCLHNFLVENSKKNYTCVLDREDESHNLISGTWRNDHSLPSLEATPEHLDITEAKTQRNELAAYFSVAGAVAWQDKMISY